MNLKTGRPKLFVDGLDGDHVIRHVLKANGVDTEQGSRTFDIEVEGDLAKFWKILELSLKTADSTPVGFVVDAESDVEARWDAIQGRLRTASVKLPPAENRVGGVILELPLRRIGFWVMPDNQSSGALEEFLAALIRENDVLIAHAHASTDAAVNIERRFSDPDRRKAILSCWLAWQEEPGLPYGTAIRAGYFDAEQQRAKDFANWFRDLYSL